MSYCYTIVSVIAETTLKFVLNARSKFFEYLVLKAKKNLTIYFKVQKLPLFYRSVKLLLEVSVVWFVFLMKMLLKRGVLK